MLISELYGTGFSITYDNPKGYPQMIAALNTLGRIKTTWNKTTVFLYPKDIVSIRDIKAVVRTELKSNGTSVILGVGSKECWQFKSSSGWVKVN